MLPPPSPVPIEARFTDVPPEVIVAFDQLLQTAPVLDVANWTVILNAVPRPVTAAAASGYDVVLTLGIGGGTNANNSVSFAPPPFDVISRRGAAALAFTAFPIT